AFGPSVLGLDPHAARPRAYANGPAARRVQVGDIIIIISYCSIDAEEAQSHEPVVIFPGPHNQLAS
ncbi:MAG: aspartate 1-decarboxylase, partial [Bacteroidota bacterium]